MRREAIRCRQSRRTRLAAVMYESPTVCGTEGKHGIVLWVRGDKSDWVNHQLRFYCAVHIPHKCLQHSPGHHSCVAPHHCIAPHPPQPCHHSSAPSCRTSYFQHRRCVETTSSRQKRAWRVLRVTCGLMPLASCGRECVRHEQGKEDTELGILSHIDCQSLVTLVNPTRSENISVTSAHSWLYVRGGSCGGWHRRGRDVWGVSSVVQSAEQKRQRGGGDGNGHRGG